MHKARTVRREFVLAISFMAACVSVPAQAANLYRGMSLYENHCTDCHESRVHIREIRKAKSLEEIERIIQRWAKVLELEWTRDETRDVLHYLNDRYYKY